MRATTISGYWKDTGDVSDMLEANRAVLEGLRPCIAGEVDGASEIAGRVTIAESARVRGSRIVGPAIMGPDAIVSGSSIGPFTSIAKGCRIEDSEIEFSIVLPGASMNSGLSSRRRRARRATPTAGPTTDSSPGQTAAGRTL